MLSNASERSNNTKAVTHLRSIASRARSDVKILSVSVKCRFLFPLWCPQRQFLLVVYSVNWFKATRSHILDRAGNNDTGLFSLATSKSPPSYGIGTISDSFHGEGNTDVKSELFMISVKIGRIAGRSSFTTAICNLSFPGALFEGNDCTILLISKEVAALNWNSPSSGIKLTGISWCEVGRPLTGARVLCQWWQIIDARGNYRCRKKSPWSQFP